MRLHDKLDDMEKELAEQSSVLLPDVFRCGEGQEGRLFRDWQSIQLVSYIIDTPG